MFNCEEPAVYIPVTGCDDCDAFQSQLDDLRQRVTALETAMSGKQDKLTAGTNITISGNTISAKDTTYRIGFSNNGELIMLDSDGNQTVISGTLPITLWDTDHRYDYAVVGYEVQGGEFD